MLFASSVSITASFEKIKYENAAFSGRIARDDHDCDSHETNVNNSRLIKIQFQSDSLTQI